jgi:lysophospholipase
MGPITKLRERTSLMLALILYHLLLTALAHSDQLFWKRFHENIVPFYEKGQSIRIAVEHDFHIAAHGPLRQKYPRALWVLPGRGEALLKYVEVFYDLQDVPFDVYMIEHRGQGESDCKPYCEFQWIESFDTYLNDLDKFYETKNFKEQYPEGVFILAHSMGGAVATLWAQRRPEVIRGLFLLAPMYEIVLGKFPQFLLDYVPSFMVRLGWGTFQMSGTRRHVERERSTLRQGIIKWVHEQRRTPPVRSVSMQWVEAAHRAMVRIKSLKLEKPTWIYGAGKDTVVYPEASRAVCQKSTGCHFRMVEDSGHEILMQEDKIRNPVLEQIKCHLRSLVSGPS